MNIETTKKPNFHAVLVTFAIFLCVWVAVFYKTIIDVSGIWISSNIYNHCFFVIPIALFFAYEKFQDIAEVETKPSWIAFVLLILSQLLWLIGSAASVGLFQHVAIFSMLSIFVVYLLGLKASQVIWFPLLFVFFAVPIGDEFIPRFQVITADLSLVFLKWSGIPVYRDGLFLTIPAGHFEVAEACSGIRFFIACVVLGAVYAYANLKSIVGRLGFIVISVLLPILANGLRAYGTIMIGHYSEMKYAAGADHLIYGWGFFAFVIVLLFVVGHFWQKVDALFVKKMEVKPSQVECGSRGIHESWANRRWLLSTLIGVLPLLFTLCMSYIVGSNDKGGGKVDVDNLPGTVISINSNTKWLPDYKDASSQHLGRLLFDVEYFIALYPVNSESAELVSSENRAFRISHWRHDRAVKIDIDLSDGSQIPVMLNEVLSPYGNRLLIISWYQLDGRPLNSGVETKLRQAMDTLTGGTGAGAFVAMSIPFDHNVDEAEQLLMDAFRKNYSMLKNAIVF